MKFKRGKLYRVVKYWNSGCIGCILRHEGITKGGSHYGTPIKLGKACQPNNYGDCWIFQRMIGDPSKTKLVEYESMVKFCKKLKEQRSEYHGKHNNIRKDN